MSISTGYIYEYLNQHKTISLEKIGHFSLLGETGNSDANGEQTEQVSENIFTYDKHAETTPEFIEFLAQKLGKVLVVTKSDLEYFLDQSRQLINLGSTPMVIDGLGYIYAEKSGIYAFKNQEDQTDNLASNRGIEDNYTRSPLTSSTNYAVRKRGGGKNSGRWILIILILALIGYAAYYIKTTPTSFFRDKVNKDSTTIATPVSTHNAETPKMQMDHAVKANTSANLVNGPYRFVIQSFIDKSNADRRIDQLKSYGNIVEMDTLRLNGVLQYQLYVTIANANSKDTSRIKDSLKIYFGHPVIIQ